MIPFCDRDGHGAGWRDFDTRDGTRERRGTVFLLEVAQDAFEIDCPGVADSLRLFAAMREGFEDGLRGEIAGVE